ncbi:hypothetical protein CLV78_101127 [Aliiruegeria haliotis]|uniref:Transcriptional activator HlyU n=1 Tax=Aliiruegeria haliotis TaxID=1280846 RepID=A0A2T0RXX1_9RHOB|nr:HlyU family transcriptional regulator [Aliiruegeria haliotis]PRY26034.1 hypothetical protein CLV78_101127 [Aliiruegeria haliotis]
MSLFKKLFGGSPKPEAEPESYKGFLIYVEPIKEAAGFRVAARIEKVDEGETRSHQLIRADVCNSEEDARNITTQKAKSLIDEQGDRLFG